MEGKLPKYSVSKMSADAPILIMITIFAGRLLKHLDRTPYVVSEKLYKG